MNQHITDISELLNKNDAIIDFYAIPFWVDAMLVCWSYELLGFVLQNITSTWQIK